MGSSWNFLRSILYNLSKIPGLGFLYDVDRMISKGESMRSSVKSLKVERNIEKERRERDQGSDNSGLPYEETTENLIAPFREMSKNATQMNPEADESKKIEKMVSEMEDLKKEYQGDSQGFMAAMQENNYVQEIPQLLAALQTRSTQQQ